MTQLGFFIDVSKCTGCKACAAACKDKNDLPVGRNFRTVREYAGGNWKQDADGAWTQDVFAYYISSSCNQCADPACVKVCPTKAHFKRKKDGLVLIDYKTDRLEEPQAFVMRYREQLRIYREALCCLFADYFPGKPAVKKTLIYSLHLGAEIEIE